jgi:hypothetical protein
MGTAALVLGVIAATFAVMIITFLLAALLGLLAVIFGGVGIARANRGEADNKRHATAGLVTGLLSLAFAVYMGIEIGTFVNDHQDDFRSFWKCITSAPSEGEQEDCASELGRRLD